MRTSRSIPFNGSDGDPGAVTLFPGCWFVRPERSRKISEGEGNIRKRGRNRGREKEREWNKTRERSVWGGEKGHSEFFSSPSTKNIRQRSFLLPFRFLSSLLSNVLFSPLSQSGCFSSVCCYFSFHPFSQDRVKEVESCPLPFSSSSTFSSSSISSFQEWHLHSLSFHPWLFLVCIASFFLPYHLHHLIIMITAMISHLHPRYLWWRKVIPSSNLVSWVSKHTNIFPFMFYCLYFSSLSHSFVSISLFFLL